MRVRNLGAVLPLTVLLFVGVVFAGCGGGGSSNPSASPTPSPTPSPSASPIGNPGPTGLTSVQADGVAANVLPIRSGQVPELFADTYLFYRIPIKLNGTTFKSGAGDYYVGINRTVDYTNGYQPLEHTPAAGVTGTTITTAILVPVGMIEGNLVNTPRLFQLVENNLVVGSVVVTFVKQ